MLERTQQRFTSLLNQYLATHLRVDSFLQELPIYFCMISNPQALIMQPLLEQCRCDPITVLKYLILIHRVLSDGTDRKDILEDVLLHIQTKDTTDFDRMLTIKLIKPYKLYLQKRLMLDQKIHANPQQSFSLINLLWSGMAFVDILYTFGRYYVYNYPFFTDFNITLGKDINCVYRKMSHSLTKDKREIILPEIQKLHQKMYIVFYNCYFYKHLKPFIPKWINTDNTAPSSAESIKLKKQGQNCSLSQSTLGFDMMGQSMLVGKSKFSKNEEDSRLQVIKSMERIVSLFN